jgi:hypothetical protein
MRSEIAAAIDSFYIYLSIQKFASEGTENYNKMNKNARVWTINLYGLQAAFFVVLGRIFDPSKESHSLERLFAQTKRHPEYFTRSALSNRKRAAGVQPEHLEPLLAEMWEPSADDLDCFSRHHAPWQQKYKTVYMPIRHKVFAHNDLDSKPEAHFNHAIIGEIDNLLYGLYDSVDLLWHLYYNGIRPEFGRRTYDYAAGLSRRLGACWTLCELWLGCECRSLS